MKDKDQIIHFYRDGKPGYRFQFGDVKEVIVIGPRLGQRCSVCGLYYFFDEDENIQELGICSGCADEDEGIGERKLMEITEQEERKWKSIL